MRLPNQVKPVVRQPVKDASPAAGVRAAATSCLLNCMSLLDPVGRSVCIKACP